MSLVIFNLKKAFGSKTIFDNFSYTFKDTGIYALTGESGVGKTTLLRLIAGLDTTYSGEILGGGIGNVSFAFQEHRLFPNLSALDNVILANHDKPTDEVMAEAKNMLLSLGIAEKDIHLTPSELSGGMRARVSLARAFLKKSPLLLLDEPTSELDAENAELVRKVIKKQSERQLVIMVTHNLGDISNLSATEIKL